MSSFYLSITSGPSWYIDDSDYPPPKAPHTAMDVRLRYEIPPAKRCAHAARSCCSTCTQHNTTQNNTTQHNTTQHNTTQQHNTKQHNTTTQHNTKQQHNTTQNKTTQHNNTTQHIYILYIYMRRWFSAWGLTLGQIFRLVIIITSF